ncbi:MAG: hypothetical protein NVS1B7_3940 [Candidatus Saccharimonadales bacterium]
MSTKKNGARNLALGTAFAAAAGYVTGILTAPKSGKETRHEIQSAAMKAKRDAESQLKKLHSELSDAIVSGTNVIKGLKKDAQKDFADALHKAEDAKEKARDLLSALHEGDAHDKDLQKAIDEVKKASEHLKTYLEKKKPEQK